MNKKYFNYIWYSIIVVVCIGLIFLLKKDKAPVEDCSFLKSGKFKYISGSPDPSAYFIVEGDTVTEYSDYGEQFTKSVVQWVGPCQLKIRTVASSYENYEFDPNYMVDAYVYNVQGDTFDFKMMRDGEGTNFKIEKVE